MVSAHVRGLALLPGRASRLSLARALVPQASLIAGESGNGGASNGCRTTIGLIKQARLWGADTRYS